MGNPVEVSRKKFKSNDLANRERQLNIKKKYEIFGPACPLAVRSSVIDVNKSREKGTTVPLESYDRKTRIT